MQIDTLLQHRVRVSGRGADGSICAQVAEAATASRKRKHEELDRQTSSSTAHLQQSNTSTIPALFGAGKKRATDAAVASFFYGTGTAFNKVQEGSFKEMLDSVADYGPGYKPPNINQLREDQLDSAHKKLEEEAQELVFEKLSCTGCTVCSDGWSDVCTRPLLNVILSTHKGQYFQRAVDTKGETKVRNTVAQLAEFSWMTLGTALLCTTTMLQERGDFKY